MRSLLGRFHRPMSRGAMGDMLTMNNLGNVSTLSLDFTSMNGTLDPLITFTRTSNATLINSSGFVQYAFSNRVPNSASLSGFTVTGVTAAADATEPGPVVAPAGTQATKVTVNVAATSVSYTRNFGAGAGTSGGMIYSIYLKPSRISNTSGFRYAIRNETTSVNVYGVDVLWANNPVTVSEVIGAADGENTLTGPDANGWYRLVLKVTSTTLIRPNDNLTIYAGYSGQGAGGFDALGAHWVWGAQLEPGLTASPVVLTDSTSAGYFNVPRFDYDSTLAAKGLLLEAPATNLLNWSETFATTGGTNNNWADTNLTRTSTNNTSPRNDATALRITASAANGTIISSAAIGTSASRVLSVWLRRVTGTGDIQYTLDNGTGYTTQVITSSWVRYSFPATTAAQRVGFRIVTSGNAIEIWGAQLETEVSTSYIPTGAGQVTRAVDTAIIAAGSNFSSWYTGGTTGTFVANWYGSASTATARSVIATNDQTTKHLHMYQTASALTLRLADFPVTTVTTANSLTAGALTKGAFSYASTATSLCLNGGTVATGTLAFTVAPTWLSIGGPSTNGTSITTTTVMLNNSIRTLQYYPARLSDGEIQKLTT